MKRIFVFFFLVFLLSITGNVMADVSGDVDGDGKVGVSEAINALQVAAGVRTSSSTFVETWKIIKAVEIDNEPEDETDQVTYFLYANGRLLKSVEYIRNRTTLKLYRLGSVDYITDVNGVILYENGYFDLQINTERYEYDVEGRLIGIYEDECDDEIIEGYNILNYNTEGKITKIDKYLGSGNYNGYELISYNSNGHINRRDEYNAGDQLQEYGLLSYEADGLLTLETSYDADDNLLKTCNFTCKKISSPSNGLNDYIHQLLLW